MFKDPEPMVSLGEKTFLVAGLCKCGWHCACPEGWRWPICPLCGEQVMPQSVLPERLAYVAELHREQDAVALVDPDDTRYTEWPIYKKVSSQAQESKVDD